MTSRFFFLISLEDLLDFSFEAILHKIISDGGTQNGADKDGITQAGAAQDEVREGVTAKSDEVAKSMVTK